jgi:hypothetical protein
MKYAELVQTEKMLSAKYWYSCLITNKNTTKQQSMLKCQSYIRHMLEVHSWQLFLPFVRMNECLMQ